MVDKYKSTNNIIRKKRDYKAYKISNSHISIIKHKLKQNMTITMDELLVKLKYKNLIRGAYDKNEKYIKRPSTRKRKPKKYLD